MFNNALRTALGQAISNAISPVSGGSSAPVLPVFLKDYRIDSTLAINATFTRTTTATVDTNDGKALALSGEARLAHASRVRNLIRKSNDLTFNTYWSTLVTGGSTVTVTKDFATAPDGSLTANRVQLALNGGAYAIRRQIPGGNLAGDTAVRSYWAKSTGGADQIITMNHTDALVGSSITVTPEWKRFAYRSPSSTPVGTLHKLDVGLRDDATDAEADVLIWHTQLENTAEQLNKNPGRYVSNDDGDDHRSGADGVKSFPTANGNTVDAFNVVTEVAGAALPGIYRMHELLATNYADSGNDLSGGPESINLAVGFYTYYHEGTAVVALAAGTATIIGAASVDETSNTVFEVTIAGTITLTLSSGSLDVFRGAAVKQLEGGLHPTSFIPSPAGGAVRNADDGPITAQAIPQAEGTLVVGFTMLGNGRDATNATRMGIVSFQTGSRVGPMYGNIGTTNIKGLNGADETVVDLGALNAGDSIIAANRWAPGDATIGFTNGSWTWDATPMNYSVWDSTGVIAETQDAQQPIGIQFVALYDKDLTQADIEALYL